MSIAVFFFFVNGINAQENIPNNAQDIYHFSTEKQQQQFQHLIQELRCLVCQNQNLADSNAPLAADLRQQVAKMMALGASETAIKNYLIKRYGDFILYRPPVAKTTYILWFGPMVLLILSLLLLLLSIRKMRGNKVSNLEQQEIQKLLNSQENLT